MFINDFKITMATLSDPDRFWLLWFVKIKELGKGVGVCVRTVVHVKNGFL